MFVTLVGVMEAFYLKIWVPAAHDSLNTDGLDLRQSFVASGVMIARWKTEAPVASTSDLSGQVDHLCA